MTTGVADTAKGGEDPGAGGSFGAVRSVNDSNVDLYRIIVSLYKRT